jgi:hypothetical protein
MLPVTCASCRKSGLVPEEFAEKRIKCLACGHRFRVENSPIPESPEEETDYELSIPDEFLDFTAPGRHPLVARTTEIDVFVAPLLGRQGQPPYLPAGRKS